MPEKLIVFLKAPRPGLVKTRLARTLGAKAACIAYVTLVESLLRQISFFNNVELRFAPDDAVQEIAAWSRTNWRLAPQGAGNLGERMAAAFNESFQQRVERIVIIGSDCPTVTAEDILTAWNELRSHDLVLGPAADGGYWLIGLRAPQPTLFDDIAWSTGEVFEQTLRRARSMGLSIQLLRQLHDVDTETDWNGFLAGQRQ